MKNILDFNNDKTKQQQMYCNKISERYDNYTNEELQFVFSAFFTPSVWEDAPKVYEEIVSTISFLEDELPIMFIGGRSQNKITRKNQSMGFFITDYTIYVLESSLFSDNVPKKFPYSMSIDKANQTVDTAINSFEDWKFLKAILPINGKETLSQLILEAVTDILTLKKDLSIPHIEKKKQLV